MTNSHSNSAVRPAVILLAVIVVVGFGLSQKAWLSSMLRSGDTVKAEFARDYRLAPDVTAVKISGVQVGVVTDVERTPREITEVAMKLDDGVLDKLGSAPSAAIRPKTILGGGYYVSLTPGGRGEQLAENTIPVSRTSIPVELDRVLEAMPPDARTGMRRSVRAVDEIMRTGGRDAARQLLSDAPDALVPAGQVLQGLRGGRPGTDLTELVSGMEAMARVFTARDGQLESTVDSLASTASALADGAKPMAESMRVMPETLRATRAGMADLHGSLATLTATAVDARPIARQLAPMVDKLDPALTKARPLLAELRPLLSEARPLLHQLTPVSRQATGVLDDFSGKPLQRIEGPIMDMVTSPYRGTGPFKDSGNDHLFYQELAYLASNAANISKMTDRNGASLSMQIGAGTHSVAGTPISMEQLLRQITRAQGGAR